MRFLLQSEDMRTLSLLGLMAALAICYVLYFRTQTAPDDLTSAESRPLVLATAQAAPADPHTAAAHHSAYKADLDRAHDSAKLMQTSHDEANSF